MQAHRLASDELSLFSLPVTRTTRQLYTIVSRTSLVFFKETSRMHPATAEEPDSRSCSYWQRFTGVLQKWRLCLEWARPGKCDLVERCLLQGTTAPRTIAHTPSSLTFMGAGGIYAINPAVAGYNVVITPDEGMVTNLAQNRVASIINEVLDPHFAVRCMMLAENATTWLIKAGILQDKMIGF